MFIFRLIKRLIFFTLFVVLVYLAAHYPVDGKPLYKVGSSFFKSDGFGQGIKDLKLFLGGFLKSVGEEIQENVTESDKQQLQKMIQEQVDATTKPPEEPNKVLEGEKQP